MAPESSPELSNTPIPEASKDLSASSVMEEETETRQTTNGSDSMQEDNTIPQEASSEMEAEVVNVTAPGDRVGSRQLPDASGHDETGLDGQVEDVSKTSNGGDLGELDDGQRMYFM